MLSRDRPVRSPPTASISGEIITIIFGEEKWAFKSIDTAQCIYEVYDCPNTGSTPTQCIDQGALMTGDPVNTISRFNPGTGETEYASIVAAEGECIVWAQFGDNTTRCPIIRGIKYCK